MTMIKPRDVSSGLPTVRGPSTAFYPRAFPSARRRLVAFRHIAQCPQVSATHLPAEEFAVTSTRRASRVDVRAAEHAGFVDDASEVYTPRYGAEWEQFLRIRKVYERHRSRKM